MTDESPVVEGGGLLGWFRRHQIPLTVGGVILGTVTALGALGWRNGSGHSVDADISNNVDTLEGGRCEYQSNLIPPLRTQASWNTTSCAYVQQDVNTGRFRAVGLVQNNYYSGGKDNERRVSQWQRPFDIKIDLKVGDEIVATWDPRQVKANNEAWATEWVDLSGRQGEITALLTGETIDNEGNPQSIDVRSDGIELVMLRGAGVAMFRESRDTPTNLGIDPGSQQSMGLSDR